MSKKIAKKIFCMAMALLLLAQIVAPQLSIEAMAADSAVMEVTVGSTTTPYTDFGKGWVAALNSSTTTPTTIKLLTDWVAPANGEGTPSFYYEDDEGDEFGTDDGRLHLDDEDINLTIDLNGHNIDRNLENYTGYGNAIYVQNGNLTITDTSDAAKAGNPGKITGGMNRDSYWSTDASRGGAIFIENDSVLRIEGGEISGNKSANPGYYPYAIGGAIFAMNDATVYMSGGVIKGNEAEDEGGGIYLWEHANFYMSGGLITGNTTGGDGGGIHCETDGIICFTGGEISGNHARAEGDSGNNDGDGGGVYLNTYQGTPDIFFGGDIKILNNTAREGAETRSDNFAIYDGWTDGIELKHAVAEQHEENSNFINVPHAPLSDGAEIWFNFDPWNLEEEDDVYVYLSDDESHFYEDSFKYFHPDFPDRLIYPVYNTEDPYEPYHEIYYVETGLVGATPTIQNVTPLSNGPLVGVRIDLAKKEICPVVKDDMKNFFTSVTLDQLVSITFNSKGVRILDTDKFVNMVDAPVTYKVINEEGAYTLYTFQVKPQNYWADNQQPATPLGDFKMTVRNDNTDVTTGYTSFEAGWGAAYNMAKDSKLGYPAVTVTLLDNWVASNGKFSGDGTDDGRLYIDESDIKITLDLNGYTINRAVGNAPVSNGSVFGLESGATLTIKDSSAEQTGKITGGNNKGKGGAFLIDYGRLILEGGTITGNSATHGGGIYMENGSDTSSRVDIRGGSISGNSASEYGGGIHCYDGNLFLEGGVISGNNATKGGGMYWESDNLTVWTGTTITGNNASACGGGVYAENNSAIYVGGSINITGNTANGHTDNLHLPDEISFLNIFKTAGQNPNFVPTMPFTNDAMIGMNSVDEDEYPFTTDYSRFDEKDYTHFSADDSNFVVRSVPNTGNSDHPYKLYLTKKNSSSDPYTISFSAGAGTGSASSLKLPQHSSYTLPECGFTAPAGASFVGWSAKDGRIYQPGESFLATENNSYTAAWKFNAPANVSFTATNDNSGVLSGVGSGMEYNVVGLSSSSGWKDISSSSVELNEMLNGNSAIYVQYKGNNGIMASDSVIIEVDQADYRSAKVQDACCDKNNGSLTHLSSDMEYSLDGSSWYAVSGDSLDNLAEGTYYVRVRAMGSVLASTKAPIAVAQKGHSFTEYSSNNDAACEADGTKTAQCDYGCGATDTIADDNTALQHSFTNYKSNGDATCGKDGTKTATCDNGCGKTSTITDEGSKKEHKYTNYVSNNDATCEADGTETAECDNGCGEKDTRTKVGSKLPHSYTKYESNGDATCTSDGTKTASCDYGCGAKDPITDEGSKLGHSFINYKSNNNASCGVNGTETAKCERCDVTDTRTDEGSAKTHSFTNYVSNNDATCTKNCTETATCNNGCGETNTREIPNSTGAHSFSTEWTSDATYHWHAATCGHNVVDTKGEHNFVNNVCSDCKAENAVVTYTVSVSANKAEYGSITGAGCYLSGSSVTVTATANEGYRFVAWKIGEEVKGTETSYTFTITADTTLTAEFEAIPSYTVTANNAEGGTVTGGGTYREGTTVTVTATANDGYFFVKWVSGNTEVSDNPYTFTITADTSLTAVYEKIPYAVTVEHGSADKAKAAEGDTVTVTAAAAPEGQRFKEWTSNDVSITNASNTTASFVMPGKAVTVTATYEPIPAYSITVTGGTSNKNSAIEGEVVVITANDAADGYRFVGWSSEDGITFLNGTNAINSFVIPAKAVAITAIYEKIPYAVTVEAGSADKNTANIGDTVTVTANVPAGQQFKAWTSDDVSITNASSTTASFVMPAKAVTVTATFEAIPVTTYAVTVTANDNSFGTVTGDGTFAKGSTVTVTATANEGYRFVKWVSGNTEVNDNPYTFTITADTTLTAVFELIPVTTYSITVTSGGSDKATAAEGETVTVFASAAPAGYRFKEWTSADGVIFANASSARTTFEMPGNAVEVKATYELIPVPTYTVKVVDGESDMSSAIEGTTVTITADAPEAGYEFIGWTSSDVSFADASSATTTFTMPGKNVTVTAKYRLIPIPTYTVIYRDGADGAVFDDYIFTDVAEGSATPAVEEPSRSGYTFKGWTPAVETTVSGDAIYVAVWEAVSSGEIIVPIVPSVYGIKLEEAVNGQVSADRETASINTVVTISVCADKGYTLETITVTDSRGKEIALTDIGNGKFSFKMPASKVVVEVSFMEDNTMLNFFVDVFPGDYYYDAVLWAVENGITSGTDELHFSPKESCTRAQAVTFLWRAAGCPAPEKSEMPFEDVAEGSYYYDAVLWALENGITNGVSESEFGPNAECTRAQIVTFLWRSVNSPEVEGDMSFSDVDDEVYYAEAVLWAVENGITNGTSDSSFSPADNCIRAQIVTFLYRAMCGE